MDSKNEHSILITIRLALFVTLLYRTNGDIISALIAAALVATAFLDGKSK